jgi:hypothetical protein
LSSEEQLRSLAKHRAREKIGFYAHLSVYVIVNIVLFSIWYLTLGPNGFPWFAFPLIGWGIGVTAHGIGTFYGNSLEKKISTKEYAKLKHQISKDRK